MLHPIILCGGAGSRLWPSSRAAYPKQFAKIVGDASLYQETLQRLDAAGFSSPVVATAEEFRFIATDQACEIGLNGLRVLVEPEPRGTAGSVLCAALMIEDDPDAVLAIMPTGHMGGSTAQFRELIRTAEMRIEPGMAVRLCTPAKETVSAPVLELARSADGADGSAAVAARPQVTQRAPDARSRHVATTLIRRGDLIAACEAHSPDLLEACRQAVSEGDVDLGFYRLERAAYAKVPRLVFDDVLGSFPGDTVDVPVDLRCNELADWDAVWETLDHDRDGNAVTGEALSVGCRDTLLRSEEDAIRVVGVGLSNVVAVAMRDAVLVADRNHLDRLPEAIDRLSGIGAKQAHDYPRYHRPWGWYETVALGERFQVKRIMVKPGGVLSLQSHVHRSEHWVVVGGTARVTVGDEVKLVHENGSVYIPAGEVHRMANPGKVPMYLIEVQTGPYLGEDDIQRFEDIYDRS
ncbi:mannose-1-phosphate guanylyltransferase/mannose-6-phosphate isomerase [Roseivivax sediminis]|uniref:mannose-1-phosphate guanylyltransferase n=1 Tax=Roseivivax sediminis TaxID=936889 RepID=A0A1I2DF53_9RHOB|nr:mannose-1-phosphate guanylyltransferase/mannose-6-phosphate isomerase [Roseivivax sediminis]SFE78590.1 mannose-1-phosphate guanylyltransferase / mannose-6-phosphate isomerase [Roseivivax sediminis]